MDYIRVYGPFVLMFNIKTKWSRGRRCRCSPPDSQRRWEAAPRSAIPRSRSHFTVRHSPDEGWWEGGSQRDGDGWRTHTTAGISFLPVSQKDTYTAFTCTLFTVCRPWEESSHCGQFHSSSWPDPNVFIRDFNQMLCDANDDSLKQQGSALFDL